MKQRILLAAATRLLASSGAQAADGNSLVGTWTGHRERSAKVEGRRDGTGTLVVTEQRGQTFTGGLRRANAEGDVEEKLWGAFTPADRLMVAADEEGTHAFELIDANTLGHCDSEAGASPRAACARPIGQPRPSLPLRSSRRRWRGWFGSRVSLAPDGGGAAPRCGGWP